MHLDTDAGSRLLKFGETPTYLSEDDLKWDKGPVTEEVLLLVAKDMATRKIILRIERSKVRRLEENAMQEPEEECRGQNVQASPGHFPSPACKGLIRQKKCRYNRLAVVPSTTPGAGYGLFVKGQRGRRGD